MRQHGRKHHRRLTHNAGKRAEWLALIYLLAKGYFPLARRYKCPVGEIDLIMSRRNILVFVEVKYRAKLDTAAYSIAPGQKSRISRAAQHWLMKNRSYIPGIMRFDVVLLAPWRWPLHISHAFVDNMGN